MIIIIVIISWCVVCARAREHYIYSVYVTLHSEILVAPKTFTLQLQVVTERDRERFRYSVKEKIN